MGNALVTRTQMHQVSHITASVLIRFNNVTQLHCERKRERIKGAAALLGEGKEQWNEDQSPMIEIYLA